MLDGKLIIALLSLATTFFTLDTESDPRGPIRYPGLKPIVSPGSVQAVNYRFDPTCEKPGPWRAKWIWLPNPKEHPTVALFRKEIQLSQTPKCGRIWVSADVAYRLYVNGRLVARGPADIGRDYDREERGPRWLYDYRDVSSSLHAGRNVVSAEVFTEGFISRATRDTHGLCLEGILENQGEPPTIIKTDPTWRATPDNGWHGDQIDLASEPLGWRASGFDDRAWQNCAAISDVWAPMAASEIPPQMEVRYPVQGANLNSQPVNVSKGVRIDKDSDLTLTYDRVIAAYPSLKIDGVRGAALKITPGEQAGQSSRVFSLKLRDGLQTFEYPVMDSFSVLKLSFSGIPVGKSVKVLDASANFTSQPIRYDGSFACSDSHLNDLWASSRWLTQICMQDHHLDSPNHQEPICDPGDYLIESHANYYTFGTRWLARQDLRKFGLMLKDLSYRNFHTSYSLLWLQMLMKYYDFTGDASLVKELAPEVHGLLDTFTGWRGKNGLISEAPNYMFMDWVTIAGFECHHPPAVIGQGYMTAFYYRALQDGIRVADLEGDSVRAARYGQLRRDVATAFERELWDEKRGLYRDGKPNQTSVPPSQWLPADKDIETFSPHVNTLAVLYDLAPEVRQAAIMDRVMASKPVNCEPYFTYFVLEALHHSDRFEAHAGELLDRWKILPGTKTYHEMWSEGDLSHAWGSAPLIQMSSTVLGVRPLTPGFSRFSVEPTVFGLSWATGAVPTPHGVIFASWRMKRGWFTLNVVVPRGCVAEVNLPGVNRHLVWAAGHHFASAIPSLHFLESKL